MPEPIVAENIGAETVSAATAAAGDTLASRFWAQVDRYGERVALRHKHLGIWQEISWAEYGESVRACGFGLLDLGIQPGDRVAILSEDRPEWLYADFGIQSAGAVTVGIYATSGAEPCGYVVGHSDAKVWILEDQEQYDKADQFRHDLPELEWIVVIDPKGLRNLGDPTIMTFEELLERGRRLERTQPGLLDERIRGLRPEDTAIFTYTSGTTGPPKAAMQSHRGLLDGMKAVLTRFEIHEDDETIVYLPLGHVIERLSTTIRSLLSGGIFSFAESPETLFIDIKEVAPTAFVGVPRTWEKLKAKIEIGIAEATPLKRWAFRWALAVGHRGAQARLKKQPVSFFFRVLHFVAEWTVLRKMKERLGLHRVREALTGAAPIATEVLEYFLALGIPLREAFGQTETGITCVTPKNDLRLGKAGALLPGVEYRLSDEGELLWRSPGLFQGYFKNPEATARATEGGWFHSGDIATFDEDGYIEMKGRVNDTFVTSGGRNIAPQEIENMLKASDYVMDAVVVGDARPFLTSLIVLDEETVSHHAQRNNIPFSSFADLSSRPEIRNLIDSEVSRVNQKWSDREQILDFRVLKWELSDDEDELTPTMKVRRKFLCERYRDLIDEMYRHVQE